MGGWGGHFRRGRFLAGANTQNILTGRDRSFLGHKINIGYKNQLWLNSLPFSVNGKTESLATAPNWNEELIEARTATLVKMVVDANLLPGESAS